MVPGLPTFDVADVFDIAVIGGGAAGLTAGIFAAHGAGGARRVVILDGAKSLGAKILVSGGGRCNVTHAAVRPEDFNGSRNIVRNVLAAFDERATAAWFTGMGVALKREETGKMFPAADSARVVLAALLEEYRKAGGVVECGFKVTGIVPPVEPGGDFIIESASGALRCARVILATGGRSLPRSGSDGSGWELARRLGHRVTPTYAALAPLVLDAKMFHGELSGIAQEVELSTYAAGKRIDHRAGSMLWTHFGVSGPVVMDASRHWIVAHETGREPRMQCNLMPGATFESIEQSWVEWGANRPKFSVGNALSQKLPERVAAAILRYVGLDGTCTCGQLTKEYRRALVHALSGLPLPVVGHRGWNYAEVTAGGVPLDEIDYRRMASRKVPRLYLAGEILDCDGRIGGFNFQWAWATGYLAGTAAAKSLG